MKAVIYVRTSTVDQFPEKQIEACKTFCNDKGFEVMEILEEKISGFKDIARPKYEKAKQMARNGQIKAVVVWALDRWVRNRDTLLEDVTYLKGYNVKLYSVKEPFLDAINIEGPMGRTIMDFLLGIIASLAEMESQRKSERVKMAYHSYKKENRTYKKWGRKNLPQRVFQEVEELHKKGKSIRGITREVFYYDKSNNKKFLSIGSVHKIIREKSHIIE